MWEYVVPTAPSAAETGFQATRCCRRLTRTALNRRSAPLAAALACLLLAGAWALGALVLS
jgi:hypothetical protein